MYRSTRVTSLLRTLIVAGALALAPVTSAFAQGLLGFSLSTVGTATPGSTVRYFGTFTNLLTDAGDNLYLSDMVFGGDILGDPNAFTKSDDPFFDNVPSFLTEDTEPGNEGEYYLTPGQRVMFEIFSIKISNTAPAGTTTTGDIDFLGGGPGAQDSLLGDPTLFRVSVVAGVVPEAGTLPLALAGVALLGTGIVRRRNRS